jgi:N utilization substance protein B
LLNTRRVARELALLTLAQLANASGKEQPNLHQMLGRAVDMLSNEASDRIKDAAADLASCEHRLQEQYLDLHTEVTTKKDLESALGAIDKLQNAVELLGSALELPTMIALAGADDVRDFALGQVSSYLDHKIEIDARLDKAAEHWSIDRMASLDRDILRLSMGELLWSPRVPVEVIINEAVELAKKYGTQDSGRFVNGVLSRYAEEGTLLRGGKPDVV